MTDQSNMIELENENGLVSFNQRLLTSPAFFELFERGMSLVEEAAQYLDVEGRAEAKLLDREISLAYASESMRLTTRLMQLASWLLLQRAVSEGEMTVAQAQEEQEKVKLSEQGAAKHPDYWEDLPDTLQGLIERSLRLQQKVLHFDEALASSEKVAAPEINPLAGHMNLINEAFSK